MQREQKSLREPAPRKRCLVRDTSPIKHTYATMYSISVWPLPHLGRERRFLDGGIWMEFHDVIAPQSMYHMQTQRTVRVRQACPSVYIVRIFLWRLKFISKLSTKTPNPVEPPPNSVLAYSVGARREGGSGNKYTWIWTPISNPIEPLNRKTQPARREGGLPVLLAAKLAKAQ